MRELILFNIFYKLSIGSVSVIEDFDFTNILHHLCQVKNSFTCVCLGNLYLTRSCYSSLFNFSRLIIRSKVLPAYFNNFCCKF